MKDFIKNKLRESIVDTSKIRIKNNVVNNLLVFIPFYGNERMGAFRLKNYNGDYKIHSTLLYDNFKGQGLGKGMYKFIIKKLASQGKKLYSDDNQSQEAVNVWQSLVKDGFATQIDDTHFVSTI